MPEPRQAFADLEMRLGEDPFDRAIRRSVDSYVRGWIDVDELELRVGDLLGLRRKGDASVTQEGRNAAS